VCKTLQACGLCGHGLDVCLQDDLLRGCGTPDFTAPAPLGGTPVSPTGRAEIMPQQERLQMQLRCLEVSQSLFPRPPQVADGCIVDGEDRDRGEGARAPEPGQWPGIPAGGCDPVPRLFQNPGRGDDPTDVAVF
jgi:hypothetical protein